MPRAVSLQIPIHFKIVCFHRYLPRYQSIWAVPYQGAVTISTNMAGRGVDIRLGEGVAELGGLYVIGMNKHESRRIDHQLRGRAGRQGDPGRSRDSSFRSKTTCWCGTASAISDSAQIRQQGGRHHQIRSAVLLLALGKKTLHQIRDIFRALPEGRQHERDHGKAVVEILAERPVLNHDLEISVSRRDDANIDVVTYFGTDLLNLTLLDQPEQLYLQLRRHFADFVQEERSSVGHFDLSLFVDDRAGERTFLVAEDEAREAPSESLRS